MVHRDFPPLYPHARIQPVTALHSWEHRDLLVFPVSVPRGSRHPMRTGKRQHHVFSPSYCTDKGGWERRGEYAISLGILQHAHSLYMSGNSGTHNPSHTSLQGNKALHHPQSEPVFTLHNLAIYVIVHSVNFTKQAGQKIIRSSTMFSDSALHW